MTAPSIVSGATKGVDGANTTGTTVTTPTYNTGDAIFVPVASDPVSQTFSITGFSNLYAATDIPATSPTATAALLYKENASSEPGSYTLNVGTSERQAWQAFAVTNYGGIGAQGTNNSGSSATAQIPAITTTAANSLIVAVIFADQIGTPFGAASGYTKLDEISGTSAASVAVYYQTVATPQTIAAENVSMTNEQWLAVVFEIKAKVTGGLIRPNKMDGIGMAFRGMDN